MVELLLVVNAVFLFALLSVVKKGINQMIKGLTAIDEHLARNE